MELKKVIINNYKSIKNLSLKLDKINQSNTYIFFGKNGAGKSNLLRAIRLLDEDIECNYLEERHKNLLEKIKIIGEFSLTDEEKELFSKEIKKIIPDEIFNSIIIKGFKIKREIGRTNDDCNYFPYLLFNLTNMHILNQRYIINLEGGGGKINKVQDISEIKEENSLDYFKLEKFIYEYLKDLYSQFIPKVRFWTSDEEYLITNGGNLKDFLQDPDLSIPLKNAFLFSGFDLDELHGSLDRIRDEDTFRYTIQKSISNEVTKHINEIWKDGKIKFNLIIEKEGLNWYVSITDEEDDCTAFNMKDRSDGFKQLVSILLVLSLEKRINKLNNNIILIDEPENHLYPLGIEYLRDELLHIGEENSIFISSHSIFIIDPKAYHRHFKISKNNLITEVLQVGKNNLHELDLLYQCLGTSLYKLITPNVFIVEGISEVIIFDSLFERFKKEFDVMNVKCIPSFGVGDFEKHLSFANDKLINGFALLDSDEGGNGRKKSLHDKFPEKKEKIFDIKDILGEDNLNRDKIVLEDLLPKQVIERKFKEIYGKDLTLKDNNKSYSTQMMETLNQKIPSLPSREKKRQLQLKAALSEEIAEKIGKIHLQDIKEGFPELFDFFVELCKRLK